MYRSLWLLLLGCSILASCQNNEDKQNNPPQKTVANERPRSNFTDEGTAKLMQLLNSYYSLKDALVASDAMKASEAAVNLQVSADSLEKFINDSTHILYTYTNEIKREAGSIITSNRDVELQRIPFGSLSKSMFALIKDANLKNAGIYRQYCPMAFNNQGAHWLSNDQKIRNPYFGDKMLTCGEITDILK